MGESHKRMEVMLTSFMIAHEATPNSPVAFAIPTGHTRVDSGMPVTVSHGNMATVSEPVAYPESGVLETKPAVAEYAENEGHRSQRDNCVADRHVEEFLQGFLHEHDVVLGYPEGMKSRDTVVLSSFSHGGLDDVMDLVASDIGGTVAPSRKHGRGTSNSQPPEVNSSCTMRLNLLCL